MFFSNGDSGSDVRATINKGLIPAERVTYGGTANAITLTTDASISSIPTGLTVRFRASTGNTGSTTINIDGIGAATCKTITGVNLPSGYIRTDVDTVATYDGTNWIVDRQTERGSNANGEFVRFADGTQICWVSDLSMSTVTTAAGAGYKSDSDTTWTFPAAFAVGKQGAVSGAGKNIGRWLSFSDFSSSSVVLRQNAWASFAGGESAFIKAVGYWF